MVTNHENNIRMPRYSWTYEDYSDADLWFLMAVAYQESANHLFNEMIDERLDDSFHHAKVAVYLMEHAIEIFLKGSIALAGKNIPTSHNLQELLRQYRILYPGTRFEFACAVDDLVTPTKRAPNSQFARYPVDKDGKPWEGHTHIDIILWREQSEKLLKDLRQLEKSMRERYSSSND